MKSERYWPYKHLIANVLADKNPIVKTVINKLDNVGTENAIPRVSRPRVHDVLRSSTSIWPTCAVIITTAA